MEVERIKPDLDRLVREFDLSRISPDPVEIPHEYADPGDRELAAFVAAALAYGNVRQILRSARRALAPLGPSPRRRLLQMSDREILASCEGFVHRFNGPFDLARLLAMLRRALERHGSLESLFVQGSRPNAPHVGPALEAFVTHLGSVRLSWLDKAQAQSANVSRVGFLLPRPSSGSACKRLNLFLRWMVRREGAVDFGMWRRVDPSLLIVPLDTHVWRISRYLGLTKRASADWKAAVEITEALRRLDPRDPVRYDFAISRLGILGYCRGSAPDPPCASCILCDTCRRPASPRTAPRASDSRSRRSSRKGEPRK
ncbi:TIGR02757 family protein [Candidatus Sumerlaeota bacterium]|nr:TIGR02757 family protein [Candidatus Sumerlaeota bacterium]